MSCRWTMPMYAATTPPSRRTAAPGLPACCPCTCVAQVCAHACVVTRAKRHSGGQQHTGAGAGRHIEAALAWLCQWRLKQLIIYIYKCDRHASEYSHAWNVVLVASACLGLQPGMERALRTIDAADACDVEPQPRTTVRGGATHAVVVCIWSAAWRGGCDGARQRAGKHAATVGVRGAVSCTARMRMLRCWRAKGWRRRPRSMLERSMVAAARARVCACVCVCVRARVCVCVCVCVRMRTRAASARIHRGGVPRTRCKQRGRTGLLQTPE